jgi:hypothetical protein
MLIARFGKSILSRFWHWTWPVRRPVMMKVNRTLDLRVERMEATFDAKFPIISEEVNMVLRSILIELDHIERRLDEIQAACDARQ